MQKLESDNERTHRKNYRQELCTPIPLVKMEKENVQQQRLKIDRKIISFTQRKNERCRQKPLEMFSIYKMLKI